MSNDTYKEQRKAYRKAQRKAMRRTRKRSGSVLAGLLLLIVGGILLTKEFGVFAFPTWLFTWPMILIAFGLFIGAGNAFRDPGWVIVTGIGAVFLLEKIWPAIPVYHFVWPILIIVLGFMMIVIPRRHRQWHAKFDHDWGEKWKEKWGNHYNYYNNPNPVEPLQEATVPPEQTTVTPDNNAARQQQRAKRDTGNWLEIVSIFGNIKKMVYSKEFQGGDIVSIFGGAEVDLTQADFEGKITIEMVQIFGGAKLIVPPHWQIQSEAVAVFGGIEDKRTPQANYDSNKVVVLNGTTFFGGIEIKSY